MMTMTEEGMNMQTVTVQELIDQHRAEIERLYQEGQLDTLATRVQVEATYRRGYADGFITAVNAFYTLVAEKRLSIARSYDRCWQHWETELLDWQHRDCSKLELPPLLSSSSSSHT